MENKEDIVKRLKLLLRSTRAGSNIEDLVLSADQDEVIIIFKQGSKKKINIAADSGIAIIMDVINKL